MLEKIIESSKNIIKKGKNAFLIGLTGLTLLYTLGCAENKHVIRGRTSWEFYSSDIVVERTENAKEEYQTTYNIKEIIIDIGIKELKANVTETINNLRYSGVKKTKLNVYKETDQVCDLSKDVVRKIDTGKRKTEIENPDEPWEINENPKVVLVYEDKKSPDTKVRIYPISMFKDQFATTDENGKFIFKFTEFPYNQSFSKEDLEQKIKSSNLASEVKEQYRNDLIIEILKRIEEKDYEVTIETAMQDMSSTKVINDKKSTIIKGYEIPKEKIYTVLEDFINKEINSNIVNWRVRVKDATSGMPVEDARMEIKTDAPRKEELVKKYFEGNLVSLGVTKVKDYITGEEIIRNYDKEGILILSIHKPSTYETETQHKHYVRVKLIYDGELKKTIEMAKDPKLTRILNE